MKSDTTTAEKLSFLTQWSLVALFMFPVLPPRLANAFFIVFSVLVFISCVYNKPGFVWGNIRNNALIGIPFIPYLVEYLTRTDNHIAGFELEKKMLFFFAPIVFGLYLSVYKLKNLGVYMYVFVFAMFILTMYSLAMLWYHNVLFTQYGSANGARMLRFCFEDVTGLYPTYYSLFAVPAITWLVYDFKNQLAKTKALYMVMGSAMLMQELLLAAKMPLIALILSVFYVLYKVIESKKLLSAVYTCIVAFFVLIIFVCPTLRNRTMRPDLLLKATPSAESKVVERIAILDCDKNILLDNFWLGVGSRNSQLMLNKCYADKGYENAIPYVFNAHNQFLTLAINYGFFIMLVFITGIIYFLVKTRKNPFALAFIISAVLVMLTESILERQCGVYFYILFFLVLYNRQAEQSQSVFAENAA